ncbi:hypothetical protein TRVL_05509 [Trypanosoma vivax]|nr:hypothetical protein TRVL_05509 [Trypanosoma vivax]
MRGRKNAAVTHGKDGDPKFFETQSKDAMPERGFARRGNTQTDWRTLAPECRKMDEKEDISTRNGPNRTGGVEGKKPRSACLRRRTEGHRQENSTRTTRGSKALGQPGEVPRKTKKEQREDKEEQGNRP